MSHILIGLALCAGILLYPGALTLLAASFLLALAASPSRWASSWSWGDPGRMLVPAALGSLAVVPLPWPGSPLRALSVGGLTQVGIGGLALTLLGLLGLDLLIAEERPHRHIRVLVSATSLAAILILAEVLAAPDWTTLLATPGPGAEAGRVGLGLICLLAAPWAAGPDPGVEPIEACAWAARMSVALFLVFPQVGGLPVWEGMGAWLLVSLLLGGLWGGGRRLLSRGPQTGLDRSRW